MKYRSIYLCFIFFIFSSHMYGQSKNNEIGINIGSSFINGDISPLILKGRSYSLHYNNPLNHTVFLRGEFSYSLNKGLSNKPIERLSTHFPETYDNVPDNFYLYYRNRMISLNCSINLELSNLGYETSKNWNYHIGAGIGISNFQTYLDNRDEAGVYNPIKEFITDMEKYNSNSIEGRRNIKEYLLNSYDGDFETPGPKRFGRFRLGDETNIQLQLVFNAGIRRKLTSRTSLQVEYSMALSRNDLLDGYGNYSNNNLTSMDVINTIRAGIAFKLNNNKKAVDLWTNPWNENRHILDSIATNVHNSLKDDDDDGVINAIDLEKNSIPDCVVDSKGRNLDSDKDGTIDCFDKNPYLDEEWLKNILKNKISQPNEKVSSHDTIYIEKHQPHNREDFYSTIVFFEFDSFKISKSQTKELYSLLNYLAESNRKITSIKLLGRSSSKGTEDYNFSLAKERTNSVKRLLNDLLGISDNHTLIIEGEVDYIPEFPEYLNQAVIVQINTAF